MITQGSKQKRRIKKISNHFHEVYIKFGRRGMLRKEKEKEGLSE